MNGHDLNGELSVRHHLLAILPILRKMEFRYKCLANKVECRDKHESLTIFLSVRDLDMLKRMQES
jgi:hypothetical protein